MKKLWWLGAALWCACPAGSSGHDGGDDAGSFISPLDLCDRLSAAKCDLLSRCYLAFARETPESCRTNEQSRCLADYETLKPSFESKSVEVSLTQLESCETRMKNSTCPPSFPPDYPAAVAVPFADCTLTSGLLVGKVPSGMTCTHEVECTDGTVCIKAAGVCKGTCSTSPQQDEPCGFGCGPELRCDTKGTGAITDDRCAPLKSATENCGTSAECKSELICSGGKCRARFAEGETCAWDSARLSTCEAGLACDVVPWVEGATGRCTKPRTAGLPCRFHWSCEPGLVCAGIDWAAFPQNAPPLGACQMPTDAGVACSDSIYQLYVGDECQSGTSCSHDDAHCKVSPALSESCSPSAQNCVGVGVYCKPSGSGDIGNCTGPASLNERCSFEIDANRHVTIPCSQGFCDTQSTQICRAASKALGAICGSNGECLSGRCTVEEDQQYHCAVACN